MARFRGYGVSPAEIEHAMMLGITSLGFPTVMAVLTWANQAIAENKKDAAAKLFSTRGS